MEKGKCSELERLGVLLAKCFFKRADSAENSEIEAWAADNGRRHRISRLLEDPGFVVGEYELTKAVDIERPLEDMRRRIGKGRRATVGLRRALLPAAAAVALVLVAATAVYYRRYAAVEPPVIAADVRTAIVKATESGRGVAEVDAVARAEVRQIADRLAASGAEKDDDIVQQLLAARRITTRSDKEFWATLPDGTLVHLDYDTRLIYPERFAGETRDVIVEGEAYFMVAKDRRHPFVVHTPHGTVREYGTEFHVDTRSDSTTSVVLVEGSISVTPSQGRERMMRPGERCVLSAGTCLMESVDTAPYTAWNTGNFFFREETLGRVMDVVCRWYGYDVRFADDSLRDIRLIGNFDRYADMRPTLDALEQVTGLVIEVTGRTVTIHQ